MIEIISAQKQHIPTIKKLADYLWPKAFASILSTEQIDYMMEMMYSQASIEKQMDEGHQFAIAQKDNVDIGYVSYETNHNNSHKTKIHKLYISPEYQRHGIGKLMVDYVAGQALKANNNSLFLNVNKFNTGAIGFYKKHNFVLTKKEVIDIGNGFIMDDFVFELAWNQSTIDDETPQHIYNTSSKWQIK